MGVWRELTSDPTEYVALHSLRLQIKKLNLPAAAAWRTCGHSLRALLLPRSLLQLAVQPPTSPRMHLSLRVVLERAACCARSAASFTLSPAVTFISPWWTPSRSSSTPRSSRRGPSSRRGGRKEDRGRGERVRDAGVTLCDLREQRIRVHLTPRSRTSSGRSTCTTSPPFTSTTRPSCTR